MITEEIVHIKGYPQKLVVFLHGYIDAAPFLDKKLDVLYDKLDNFAIHLPQSPCVCEVHSGNRQWYSMHRFDPDDARKTVATLEECIGYYNRMTLGLQQAYDNLVPYIEQALDDYQLEYKDLILCGFSQGAMVALYTALMLPQEIGAVISLSGIFTGGNYLMNNARQHPRTLLIHGMADNQVRFEALEYTKDKLQQLGCPVTTQTVKKGMHEINSSGLSAAIKYIKSL